MADVIIRNGRVLDGSGNPWFWADVSVEAGRIHQVGRVDDHAPRQIDARGMIVCPGFIDIHTHADLTILHKEVQDYKLRQGITTEVSGNCGFTAAPLNPKTEELLKLYLAFITPSSGVTWQWRTFADYLETVDTSKPATNMAPLVGHGTLRIAVMGFDQRDPTINEVDEMKALLEEGMQAGAFGMSTGLIYVPGTYAATEEIIELAKVASSYHGIYATHMRNEGAHLLESIEEAIRIGREANLPVQISHHKATGKDNHGKVKDSLALLESARSDGLDVTADQYPYVASSTTLQAILPPWAQEGGVDQVLQRLQDPDTRTKIRDDLLGPSGETRTQASLDNVMISSVRTDANKRYVGLSLTDIGHLRNQDPADVAFDLLVEERCAVVMVGFVMAEEDVRAVMVHSTTMVGTDGLYSDGNPHPRVFGTYPRILGRYVREQKLMKLEEAVRKMTSFPAQKLGLTNKGVLRPGADADIVVFDPETVIDKATFQQARQYPDGIAYVLVNGQVSVDDGSFTGVTAGRVLFAGPGPN